MAETSETKPTLNLPIISLADQSPANAQRALAAATKYGFLYLDTRSSPANSDSSSSSSSSSNKENGTGLAMTGPQIEEIFHLSEALFRLPTATKAQYAINTANQGWTGLRNETLDPAHQKQGDFKEAFNIGELGGGGGGPTTSSGAGAGAGAGAGTPTSSRRVQDLPDLLLQHREQIHAFAEACRTTVNRVLDLLAAALDIEDAANEKEFFFSNRHTQPSGATLRLLYYPTPSTENGDGDGDDDGDVIRAGAHSDYGSCTLLFQRPGQPGLEIRTPEGSWAPVPVIPEGYISESAPAPPPILVNFGDLLSYWTNGLLKSTVHRVVIPTTSSSSSSSSSSSNTTSTGGRYSIAYFAHPGDNVELVPVPSKLVRQHRFQEGEQVGYGGGAETADTIAAAGASIKPLTAREYLHKRLEATYAVRQVA